ncbi:MAG: hypothetical protein ACFB51_01270 [Anaerolineae bacterium]
MAEHTRIEGTFNVYEFQRSAMPVLTGWAVGSILMGLLWWQQRSEWLKGFGSQFAGWGVINLIIAVLGLRGAASNAEKYAAGEIEQPQHDKATRTFEIALWVNAVLDVLYVVGGSRLAASRPDDEQRQGMGWGIIAQGAGLLVWDVILALVLSRARRRG